MIGDATAIFVRSVGKRYKVFENQRERLLHTLRQKRRSGMREVWALRDVSFEIRRGGATAIIGRNGSGKSTLLKILTGILNPTTGEVKINGRVSALLELGSGFNPEYSGRDNVILNGLLLGLDRKEILRRFDEIVTFAEIGDVLERPVKTYSSGMMMRLAFAVQVLSDPDILIIDEALSVGDFFFQQKCLGYIRSLCDKGVTLLFVSHDMATVRDLCSRAVYLAGGKAVFVGDCKEAIREYLKEQQEVHASVAERTPDNAASKPPPVRDDIMQAAIWKRSGNSALENTVRLLAVVVLGPDGHPATQVQMGDTIRMRIYFQARQGEEAHISLTIKNRFDQIATVTGSRQLGLGPCPVGENVSGMLELCIKLMLEAGLYSFQISYATFNVANKGVRLDETEWLGPLQIYWNYENNTAPFLGMVGLPVTGAYEAGV
ncbi:MAG TPA: ABC transporter ATP-binding protein [Gammaproteobacteria bacterium]|nr:ABC transporter ATP-binding protein [Gammaproteobacteria bacterium]